MFMVVHAHLVVSLIIAFAREIIQDALIYVNVRAVRMIN